MFGILLWPLTAFCNLVCRAPLVSIGIGVGLTALGFATNHGAWASVAAMFVGFVLIWLSESANPHRASAQAAAAA